MEDETTANPFDETPPTALDGPCSDLRGELEALVAHEGIPKDLALSIVRLHHRMEVVVMSMKAGRELDRLNHTLERNALQSEINSLTLRLQHEAPLATTKRR